MTVDHFPGNPFSRFSNPYFGPFGFFTAALGFVFLSGLVAGWVYDARLVRDGTLSMAYSAVRRASVLYAAQLALCVLIALAIALHLRGAANWDAAVFVTSPLEGLLYSGSLLYEPGYLGLLPMYCLFLLFTPLIVWQFARGRSVEVLVTSVVVWICAGLFVRLPEDANGIDFGGFNPFSYQLLYVAGLAFGTGVLRIEDLLSGGRSVIVAASTLVAATLLIARQIYAIGDPLDATVERLHGLLSAIELGPIRLLDFAAFAIVVYAVTRRLPRAYLERPGARWLAFIGRNSLPVFVWSIAATYLAAAVVPNDLNRPERVAVLLLVLASLSIPAWARSKFRDRQRPVLDPGASPAVVASSHQSLSPARASE